MGKNSLAGHFFEITDFFFHFLNRHHHTTANVPTPTLTQPTTQHIPTHTNTSPISSTDTGPFHSKWREACIVKPGQLFLARCEHVCFLHDANMFARQGMSQGTRTPTLSQVRAVCTRREPTGRVIIVIVAEREDRREKEEREDKREESREREGEKEREQERQTESKKDREGGKPLRV